MPRARCKREFAVKFVPESECLLVVVFRICGLEGNLQEVHVQFIYAGEQLIEPRSLMAYIGTRIAVSVNTIANVLLATMTSDMHRKDERVSIILDM